MKPIKLAQYGSTIAILVTVAFLMVVGCVLIFKYPDRIGTLVTLGTVLAVFIAPEKIVAIVGPAWKRKQENGPK